MEDLTSLVWAQAPPPKNSNSTSSTIPSSSNKNPTQKPTNEPLMNLTSAKVTSSNNFSNNPSTVNSFANASFGISSSQSPQLSSMPRSTSQNNPMLQNLNQPIRSSSSVSIKSNNAPKDAFESLVNFGNVSSDKKIDPSRLSLLEQQKISKAQQPLLPNKSSLPLSGFENNNSSNPIQLDAWNFEAVLSSPPKSNVSQVAYTDDALSEFLSGKAPQISSAPTSLQKSPENSNSIDDFGIFSSAPAPAAVSPPKFNESLSSPPLKKEPTQPSPVMSPVNLSDSITSKDLGTTPKHLDEKQREALVSKLVDFGFDIKEARFALEKTNYNLEEAADGIIAGRFSGNLKKSGSNSNIGSKLSKLGLSEKHAEKASQLLNSAGDFGKSLFNKAKNLVADSAKKVSAALEERSNKQYVNYNDEEADTMRSENFTSIASKELELPKVHQVTPTSPPSQLPQKKKRTSPQTKCSPDIVARVEKLKEDGNDFTKKGQYGDAEEKYSQAIDLLSSTDLLLINLKNNRAAARLKIGKNKECLTDCTDVEELIVPELEYDDTDSETLAKYKDSLSKAYLRRATAYEALEKWADAVKDYKKTLEVNPNAKTASDGVRRCVQSEAKSRKGEEEFKSKPSEVVSLASLNVQPTSSAALDDINFLAASPNLSVPQETTSARVEELRAKELEKSQEDSERLRVKDSVDAKLNTWKLNKKDNIRGLIASLDTVLWQELKNEWKSVNLSELVTPKQVKICYTKAIAKLHPDKLSSMSLSVEQKLLANGIFSTLNDAWDAFKVQNNIK